MKFKGFQTIILLVFIAFSASKNSVADDKIPEDFKFLDKNQQLLLEVSIPGKKIGFFLADVNAETVVFEKPQELMNLIPLSNTLTPAEKKKLLMELSAPHKRNSQLVCEGDVQANGCGYIKTDSVEYIYDEANQAVSIFFNKNWLDLNNGEKQALYFQPSADLKNALVHRQTVNYFANREYKNLSVSGVGALGVAERGYLGMAWRHLATESPHQSFSETYLDQFYYRYDIGNRYYIQTGRMDQRNLSSKLGGAFGFSLLPIGTMDGLRLGSTEAYVNESATSQGTPLNIILTAPSRVEVYRGKELLGTEYVEGGLQSIRTADYPDGSYLLTLKVFENGRLVRTETQPFSKTIAGIGSAGDFQWFVQTGSAEDKTQQNTSLGQGKKSTTTLVGARLNTGFNTAATLGAEQVRNVRYAESKFEWALPTRFGNFNTTANFFYGSDGSRGDTQQIYWRNGINASLYRYNVSSKNCETDNYLSCYQTISATVGANLLGWSTTLGYNVSKTQNRPSRVVGWQDWENQIEYAKGTNTNEYGSPINTFSNRSLQLNFSKSFSRNNWIFNPNLSIYRSQSGEVRDSGITLSLTLSRSSPATGSSRTDFDSLQATLRQSKQQMRRENYTLRHVSSWNDSGYRELGASINTDNNNQRGIDVSGRADTGVGYFSGTVSQNQSVSKTQTDVSGQYSSSFAVTPDVFAWGSDNGGSDALGGLIFEAHVDGDNDSEHQSVADIEVQGNSKTTVHAGEKNFFPIEGFQNVKSHVEDAITATGDGISSLKHGSSDQNWFMQPGKLGVRKVTAIVQYTYFGQLLVNGDNLLAGAIILNATVPNVNEDGSFLAEFNGQPKNIYVVKNKALYQCPIKILKTVNGLRQLGVIECQTITENALPTIIKSYPRVVKILKAGNSKIET